MGDSTGEIQPGDGKSIDLGEASGIRSPKKTNPVPRFRPKPGECIGTHTLFSAQVGHIVVPLKVPAGSLEAAIPEFQVICAGCGKTLEEVRKELNRPPSKKLKKE